MAGEWIKMRTDLKDDPAVFRLSKALKMDRPGVIGRLHAFWAWADLHAVNGRLDGAEESDVDQVCERKGFAHALVAVGWLEIGDGHVSIPQHDRHNGNSAKERSLKNARQARWRDGKASTKAPTEPPTHGGGNVDGAASTSSSTREEKRREEACLDADASKPPVLELVGFSEPNFKNPPAVTNGVSPTTPVWTAYAQAYESRYGVAPPRDARSNAMLATFLRSIPADEAPAVAAWYVRSDERWYVQKKHPISALVNDAAKLRTEWYTGTHGTETAARLADQTGQRRDVWGKLIQEAKDAKPTAA